MNNKPILGGDLMLFINDGGTKYPIAHATSSSLNITTDTIDVISKDSGNWKEYLSDASGFDISGDGMVTYNVSGSTLGVEDLFAKQIAGDEIEFAFAVRTGTSPDWTIDSSLPVFEGKALITNLNVSASKGDKAAYSYTLQGTGELTLS